MKQQMKQMKSIGVLRQFFETDSRKVSVSEFKALSTDERHDLARLAVKELPNVKLID
jgi:hypothetical protein